MSSSLNDINLAFLDASDVIVEIVTYDSTTIHNTVAIADTFRVDRLSGVQGPLPRQSRRLAGRDRSRRRRARPRARPGAPRGRRTGCWSSRPTTRACRSCWPVRTPPISRDVVRVAERTARAPVGWRQPPVGPETRRVRSAADRGLRLRGRRADRPARDRPALAGRVDDLPRRQRPRAVRRRAPTTRSWPSRSSRSTCWPSATSRRSSWPATRRRRSRSATLRRRYDLPILGVIRPGAVGGRPGDAQSPRRGDRDAGDDPLARLLRRRSRTRTPRSRSTSTRRRRSSRWSRPATCRADRRGDGRRGPRAAARRADAARGAIVPAAGAATDRHAPARLHALPAAALDHRGRSSASRSRSSTPPPRPPRRSPSCWPSTGSRRPAPTTGRSTSS